MQSNLRLGSVAHFGAEQYFVLCPKHSAATPQHEPAPVERAERPSVGGAEAKPQNEKRARQEEAEQVARQRESKASKLVRLSGSAAQIGKGGARRAKRTEPWWTALPDYVPPIPWATLLPLGTERTTFDKRRWRVSHGEGGNQVWEPLAEGSDELERDDSTHSLHGRLLSDLYEVLDPVELDSKLGPGAAECGWRICEAYVGSRKAGNWRYISPRGVKFKTKAEAHAARAAGGDAIPKVKLIMSRGGACVEAGQPQADSGVVQTAQDGAPGGQDEKHGLDGQQVPAAPVTANLQGEGETAGQEAAPSPADAKLGS